MAMICPNCGKQLAENVKFCMYCGYRLPVSANTGNQNYVVGNAQGAGPGTGQTRGPAGAPAKKPFNKKLWIPIIVAAGVIVIAAAVFLALFLGKGSVKKVKITDNGWSYIDGKYGRTYDTELSVNPSGNYRLYFSDRTCDVIDGTVDLSVDEEEFDYQTLSLSNGFYYDPDGETKLDISYGYLDVDRTDYDSIKESIYDITLPIYAADNKTFYAEYKVTADTGQETTWGVVVHNGEGTLDPSFYDIAYKENPDFSYELIGTIVFPDKPVPEHSYVGERTEEITEGINWYYVDCEFYEPLNGAVIVEKHNSSGTSYAMYTVTDGKFSIFLGSDETKATSYDAIAFKKFDVAADYTYTINGTEERREKTFKEICDEYNNYIYITAAADYSYLYADTNPYDSEDAFDEDTYQSIKAINEELGFSDAVFTKMGETRSIDGRQTESNDRYTVSWSYHPDYGLEVLYEER